MREGHTFSIRYTLLNTCLNVISVFPNNLIEATYSFQQCCYKQELAQRQQK